MKDGQGNYLWREAFLQGQPATLLGFPVAIDENMPTSLRTRFRSRLAALSRCRAQARRVAHRLMSGWDTGRVAPRLERFGAEEALSASRDEVTRNGEDVVGGRMQGQEPLG